MPGELSAPCLASSPFEVVALLAALCSSPAPAPGPLCPQSAQCEPHTWCACGEGPAPGPMSWNSPPSQPSQAASFTPRPSLLQEASSGPRGAGSKGHGQQPFQVCRRLFSSQVFRSQERISASKAATPLSRRFPASLSEQPQLPGILTRLHL